MVHGSAIYLSRYRLKHRPIFQESRKKFLTRYRVLGYNESAMKNSVFYIILVGLLVSTGQVSASHGRDEVRERGGGREVRIPSDAEQISENVSGLRPAYDRESKLTV